MAIIPIDVTTADLIPEGHHVGTINGIKYQLKTGAKFNKVGITNTTQEEFASYPNDKKRIQYLIAVPGYGNIFHELYMGDKSKGFVKSFLKAAKVSFNKDGFDPEEAVGQEIGVNATIVDDPDYGESNSFTFFKV